MLHTSGHVAPDGIRCLQSLVEDNVISSAVYMETSESTNSLALDELNLQQVAIADLSRLYLTDMQTAGRGRLGRSWSSSGDSLTFSILVEHPQHLTTHPEVPLSLLAGVVTAEAIDALLAPVVTQLKWPNDIYVQGHKVGGILVEASGKHRGFAAIGIGINVHTAPSIESVGAATADSLDTFCSRPLDRFDVLDEIVRRLVTENSPASITHRFRQKCYLTGQQISLNQAGSPITGFCQGIDDSGRLLVNTGREVVGVQSGEATLVRRR